MKRKDLSNNKLTPDSMPFSRPDFGFNDYMNFDDDLESQGINGWRSFLDCFSLVPKYERVKNYIDFIHDKKITKLRASIPDSALRKLRTENNKGLAANGKI